MLFRSHKIRRILGDLLTQGAGLPGVTTQEDLQTMMASEAAITSFKRLKNAELDVILMPDATPPSIRQAQFQDLMSLQQAGFPIDPAIMLDASDAPQKEKIRLALQQQNNVLMPPPARPTASAPAPSPSPMGGAG